MALWLLLGLVYVCGWSGAMGFSSAESHPQTIGGWLVAALISAIWPIWLPFHVFQEWRS